MNSHRCCQSAPHRSWMRRVREIAGLVLPSTLLALMPKCPMCLAAYVALGTGFTMSYSSAHVLMRVLTVLCLCTLAFCVTKRMMKHFRSTSSLSLHSTHLDP